VESNKGAAGAAQVDFDTIREYGEDPPIENSLPVVGTRTTRGELRPQPKKGRNRKSAADASNSPGWEADACSRQLSLKIPTFRENLL
jgi:hypothetical protein